MRVAVVFVLMLLAVLQNATALKVLGIFPLAGYSHYILGGKLLRELAARGHDVTMLAAYEEKNSVGKYKTVLLTGFQEHSEEMKDNINFFTIKGQSTIEQLLMLQALGNDAAEKTLSHPNTQKLLASNQKFDVIILEQFFTDALKGICHHYNAPCVLLNSISTNFWTNIIYGNPTNPSYVNFLTLDHAGPMDFFKRLHNSIISVINLVIYHGFVIPKANKVLQKHFPSAPPMNELMFNSSLILLNSHVTTAPPVPLMPNMIEIGGFHVTPAKKLPAHLQKFLDEAKEGVVYFSMGSNLRSKQMPVYKRNAILKAFEKLKMKVLWKFEEDLPGKPDNVKIDKWLPQQDILAHPNVKLFITHGGLLSTIESIYHGVPIIGIPIFGDQATNMKQAVNSGYGLLLDYNTINEPEFSSTLDEILTNKKYAEKAKINSKMMHDQDVKPMDRAVFWIEYVVRHKGAYHYRSVALDLAWYQYLLLDVIAFIALAALAFIIIGIVLCKKLCKKFCNKCCTKSNEVNQNKKNK